MKRKGIITINKGDSMVEDKQILLENINKVHTTKMGIDRIKKNLLN